MERNYWMFRVSEKWGKKIDYCKENNLIYCGWNIGLSVKTSQEVLAENPWASRMAVKFCYIQEGDIIIMPTNTGIAIAIAKSKQLRNDLDWKDTINVDWLTKYYPRKDLTSKFQTKLKFRGTFLNLGDIRDDIENLIKSGFNSLEDEFKHNIEKEKEKNIFRISEHLNKRDDLYFQDLEFEKLVMKLFELEYQGFVCSKNSQRQEFHDGKDITASYDIADLNINVELNIQVKQHKGNASLNGISQISKSVKDEEDMKNTISRNILVTSGLVDDEFRKRALKQNVYVFGPEDIARLIVENFSELDEVSLQKLQIVTQIHIAN